MKDPVFNYPASGYLLLVGLRWLAGLNAAFYGRSNSMISAGWVASIVSSCSPTLMS